MSCITTGEYIIKPVSAYLTHARPTAGTLDKWATEVEDDSYQFQNLLPFFRKSVHYTPADGLFRLLGVLLEVPFRRPTVDMSTH